ncbi:protein SAR DEFICIENT 1-like [Hibiscus syriacus]|uniref:protein SAR DEFICIENT 1-like n=1 Tax=Hibiscus syriacus TaxID=106335 RepID=UPI001922B82F|nr:protein SAR DEFICIENT 1-like [Hibiscus syriacus]
MIPQLPATTLPTMRLQTQSLNNLPNKTNVSPFFVIKSAYEKHYPPMLGDEVWRLEKIGKDGLFHKNLASMGVNTVQDFLKMLIVHPGKLRRIFGVRMSEKMWNVTIKHAKTCVMGNKHYVFQGSDYRIMLNPICQLIKAEINGSIYPTHKQSDVDRAYLKDLVRQAYVNWSSLEEIEGISNEIGNLIQGDHVVDQYPDHSQIMVWPSTATGDCVAVIESEKQSRQ